jgi:protein SCO1/2
MVSALVSRYLPLSVAAFALAGMMAVGITDRNSIAPASELTTIYAPIPAHVGDLPDVALETAAGTRTTFAATNGHVRISSVFYSHCPGVCPALLETLRGIEEGLTQEQRSKLNFVLMSLDPTRDTPSQMRAIAAQHGIQSNRWLMGRTSPADLAAFAAAIHVRYRSLSDGSIDHSNSLVLLNEQGAVVARWSDGESLTQFDNAVRQAVDSAGAR